MGTSKNLKTNFTAREENSRKERKETTFLAHFALHFATFVRRTPSERFLNLVFRGTLISVN